MLLSTAFLSAPSATLHRATIREDVASRSSESELHLRTPSEMFEWRDGQVAEAEQALEKKRAESEALRQNRLRERDQRITQKFQEGFEKLSKLDGVEGKDADPRPGSVQIPGEGYLTFEGSNITLELVVDRKPVEKPELLDPKFQGLEREEHKIERFVANQTTGTLTFFEEDRTWQQQRVAVGWKTNLRVGGQSRIYGSQWEVENSKVRSKTAINLSSGGQ